MIRVIRSYGVILGILMLVTNVGATIEAALEEPGSFAAGIGNVRGWAYSTTGQINPVLDVLVDGQAVIEIPCCASRQDVRDAHPEAPVRSGFSGALNWSLLSSGPHTVAVRITSTTGESLTTPAVAVNTQRAGNATFLREFDVDNGGAGDCIVDLALEDSEPEICCDEVRAEVNGSPDLLCSNVCYRWSRGAQAFIMRSATCSQ
jgi:hypothetical protein